MSRMTDQAQHMVAQRRIDDATALLIHAADEGDGDAAFMLAGWRIQGNLIGRDLEAARALMARAAAAGRPDAALLHAYFLANGTGGPSEWGEAKRQVAALAPQLPALREQLDMISRMPVDEEGDPTTLPEPTCVSEHPFIVSAKGMVSAEERAWLIRQAEPLLRRASVVDRATGRTLAHPDRRSDTMLFGVGNEDLVISALRRRIAAFCGVDPAQTEALQVIRYGVGDEFRPHFDAVAAGENQRILTALVYLTEDYEGGETRFLKTGLDFRGEAGEILMFRNADAAGRPEPLSEHAGLPVTRGTKIILSCWIRERPWRFPPPVPASRRF